MAIIRRATTGRGGTVLLRVFAVSAMGVVALFVWLAMIVPVAVVCSSAWEGARSDTGERIGAVVSSIVYAVALLGCFFVPMNVMREVNRGWVRDRVRELASSDACVGCEYSLMELRRPGQEVICPECGLVYPAPIRPAEVARNY